MSARPLLTTLPVLTLVSALLAGCGGDDTSTATDSGSGHTTACDYPTDSAGAAKPVDPPSSAAPDQGTVDVTIATSVGDLKATLDRSKTPCTVNSFLSLAQQGFFDDTQCHRLTTAGIFVLQCGDPTGTGSGGPGYSFADELDGSEKYGAGTLAMANAGPDTNGSQFFVVYGDTQLPPSYTVFGHVDDAAVALVEKVAKKGTDNAFGQGDGHPNEKVTISSVTAD
jgi:peptidyl-prolyl cis-trans isomerase B (cyclophilin B)